jgi:hypothetical protein
MDVTLLLLAAGMSRRFGRLKQLEPLGPEGEALLDYSLFDGLEAGCTRVVVVVRPEIQDLIAAHLEYRLGEGVDWDLVEQAPDDLPDLAGGDVAAAAAERTRPWGTGQAVWAARHLVAGPMVVANADDFYGGEAFKLAALLAGAIGAESDPGSNSVGAAVDGADGSGGARASWLDGVPCRGGLITYRLERTLARSGGVSRGVCSTTEDGRLRFIEEFMELRRVASDSEDLRPIAGRSAAGEERFFSGGQPVSLNLWAFGPEIFDQLGERFAAFLDAGPEPDAEFFLPTAVQELVAADRLTVATAAAPDRWLGVTHPEDAGLVREGLLALHDAGHYPPGLAKALRARSSR